jgi:hypothetical protein
MRRKAPVAALFCVWVVGAAFAFAQEGNPADIVVTPPALPFSTVCVGGSPSKTVTIKNNDPEQGGQPLHVSDVQRIGGVGATSFAFSDPSPITLDPQETESFTVTFNSSLPPGNRSTTFRVSSDGDDTSISVPASATVVHRLIGVNPATVAFGEQRVGTRSPTKVLIVSNPGQDTLAISVVKKVGTNAADFVVPIPAAFSLAPGATKGINVAFQPTGDGLRRATLEITSNSCTQPKLNVSLVGTGVIPNVVVQPNPIDVGTSSVGKKGKPTAVTVSNEGAAVLKITTIQIIGENAADFALSGLPPVPKTLQPDESFVFAIRMTPTEEGLRLASINVLSDDPDVPTLTVSVRGSATAASPSPSASASASVSPTTSASVSSTASPLPAGTPNDSLAIMLVVGGVLSAFVGLMIVRRFIRTPEEE